MTEQKGYTAEQGAMEARVLMGEPSNLSALDALSRLGIRECGIEGEVCANSMQDVAERTGVSYPRDYIEGALQEAGVELDVLPEELMGTTHPEGGYGI